MSTNIEFKSNVYPIVESIQLDKLYLSKIYDYERLTDLNKRFFKFSKVWNELQLNIIDAKPTCAIDTFKDPCWGLIKNNEGYKWECRCVNVTCKLFKECRNSFDYSEYELFSPLVNSFDETSYGYKRQNYKMHPIEFLESEYVYGNDNEVKTATLLNNKIEKKLNINVIPSFEIIKYIDKIEHTEQNEHEEIKDKSDESAEVNKNEITLENKEYVQDIQENIFNSFVQVEQMDIIEASPSDVIFVDAGPGTGKTFALIQKINYMVTECEVEPESILVLCFTNAAVDEIKNRLNEFISKGGHRGLANVDIRTFHSFAWWLIGQANELFVEDGWCKVNMGNMSFDTSLILASNITQRFSSRIVDSWEHFIVDEVQDLTNNLARFVLNIINSCINEECGITVLGDSCQAIYDYIQNENKNKNTMTSEEFYKALYEKIKNKAHFYKLTVNHRQTTDLITLTTKYRDAIINQDINKLTSEVSLMMDNIQYLEKTAIEIKEEELSQFRKSGRLCFLLRNNGQTLRMSTILRKRGISHVLNASETHQNYASWISEVFYLFYKPSISYKEFENLYENTSIFKGNNTSAILIWQRLKKLMHSHSDVLVVSELLESITDSKIDDSILRSKHNGDIIVSNIHRAKGREYDCVVLDKNFADSLINNKKEIYDYKTLYVAVTRPKKSLYIAPLSKNGEISLIPIFKTKRNRWGKAKRNKIVYFEFFNDLDIDVKSFLTTDQSYISKISEGDQLELRRVLEKKNVNYDIIHFIDDVPTKIGQIGKTYIEDLMAYMKISENNLIEMPAVIEDLYVTGIYSYIANENYKQLYPEIGEISPNGIWKWVEFIGIGHAIYDVY